MGNSFSTWDVHTAHQTKKAIDANLMLILRIFNHWILHCEHEDFIAMYPLQTADMSILLTNEWSNALIIFCREQLQQEVIPSVTRESMLGHC